MLPRYSWEDGDVPQPQFGNFPSGRFLRKVPALQSISTHRVTVRLRLGNYLASEIIDVSQTCLWAC